LLRKNGETPLVATPRPALGHALQPSTAGSRTGSLRAFGARTRLRAGLVLGVAASACVTLVVLPGSASAEPDAAEVTQLVATASHQLEVVSEQVNQARVELRTQQAVADRADRSVALARARFEAMRGKIRQIARAAYTTGDVSRVDVLLTSRSPGELLSQMGTLDAIAGHQADVLKQASKSARDAQHARAVADRTATAARKTLDTITAKQAQLKSQIADYKAEYARLTAAQQQAVSRQVAGVAVRAPARAPAPARAAAPAAAPAPVAASSQAAQVAVQTALAQVGKPYVWGASGPSAFDCSGLTMYSYAAAGVALPHSSSAQSTMGIPVSRGQLQPGDLVFFYSPVSHVGMYIGNGQMVHASTEGTPVQVVSLDSMPGYNSARRIAG
jgi:cell wall-associated NlpC family hydrolase